MRNGVVVAVAGVAGACWLAACAASPDPALSHTDAAWVKVQCAVGPDGRPQGCVVLEETPLCVGRGREVLRVIQSGRLSRDTMERAAPDAAFVATVPCPPRLP